LIVCGTAVADELIFIENAVITILEPDGSNWKIRLFFFFFVVYSVPAAGSLNAHLACRQSVVIGCKLERRSNSVIADAIVVANVV